MLYGRARAVVRASPEVAPPRVAFGDDEVSRLLVRALTATPDRFCSLANTLIEEDRVDVLFNAIEGHTIPSDRAWHLALGQIGWSVVIADSSWMRTRETLKHAHELLAEVFPIGNPRFGSVLSQIERRLQAARPMTANKEFVSRSTFRATAASTIAGSSTEQFARLLRRNKMSVLSSLGLGFIDQRVSNETWHEISNLAHETIVQQETVEEFRAKVDKHMRAAGCN
jgi:hypothetical protein